MIKNGVNNTTIINLCNNFLNEQDIRQYLDVYKEKKYFDLDWFLVPFY